MGKTGRENFYLLLELAYDPPVTDPGRIRAALHAKKQEWTRWQDLPGKRNTALTNLGLAEEIERVMLNPLLREQEAVAAQRLREDMLRRFEAELRILEGKGHLLPREAGAIAVKYKLYGVDMDYVKATARCPIAEAPPQPKDDFLSGETLDRITAKKIQRDLALLREPDLYAFLGEQPYSSVKKLRDAAEQKRRAAAGSGSRSSAAAITQELAGICLQLFADFDSKQRYDRYLQVAEYPVLADMIDEEYTRAKHVSAASLLRLVNFGVETYALKVLEAEEHIRRYCAAYDIPVGSAYRKVSCPACANQTDSTGAVCTVCAAPLRGECPGCGTLFEHGPAVCPACGFVLADLVKALHCIGEAENALIENNWSTARRSLQYAEKYWPGHPKLQALDRRARLLEERYAHYVDSIADCMRHNQYYAALDLVREAGARRIQLPLATAMHVETVIADFEQAVGALQRLPQPPPFEEIARLAETVRDSMEINHLMRRHPPRPPERLSALVEELQVHLAWDTSPSPGMKEYTVVRKQTGWPLTAYDGDVLYRGPANSFVDTTAAPLTEYHYAVYSRRGGAYSEAGALSGAVLVVPEIENLRILPTDCGAQLSWGYNPSIREVIIWRKLGGDRPTAQGEGMRLKNARLDGFTDSRLKNGVEYWYYLIAVYIVGGQKVYARGICGSVTPRQMLAPIEELIVLRTGEDEDEYIVSWQGAQYSDVLLFASPRRPACRKGEMLPLIELIEDYRKLDLDAKQPESARFHHSWNGGIYLFPAAISGRFATVGAVQYLANVKDVQSPTFDLVDGDLFINMKWPAGLTEVAVCYRFDRFAKAPEETGTTVLHCTREQYDYNAGVRLQGVEPVVYYVTVFAVFTMPEGEKVYSPGVNLLVNNTAQAEVFYRFVRTKKLFSKTCVITVTLRADEPIVLPRAVITGKVGRLPLSKNDGIPLFEIDRETRLDGSVVYEYRISSLPDDLYIRLFLQDEQLYEKLRLLPAGKLQIT